MNNKEFIKDWGESSVIFDQVSEFLNGRDLTGFNEAQTRFDVIDRLLRDVLGWNHGLIDVEERVSDGYIDYTLNMGDCTIIVEAKRIGATFPNPTKRKKLKLNGSVLGSGEIASAIIQAKEYAYTKQANVVVVTNGLCWCFFSLENYSSEDYATLLFPFESNFDAEQLFNSLSRFSIEINGSNHLTNHLPRNESKLRHIINDADGRVDRNNIADHITSALNQALYADALMNNLEALDKCFVKTEARTKFDSLLGMHLKDPKPDNISPAPRMNKSNQKELRKVIDSTSPGYAPQVTLVIGPVGAGKSTYIKHFKEISGTKYLQKDKTHWIYIDFEEMGKQGSPRSFMYRKLLEYLLSDHPENPTDYKNLIEPAYSDKISALAKGPLARVFQDKEEFNKRITDHIEKDFNDVEPYVDRLIKYICKQQICMVVLDNVDLYEDEELEKSVFSEGLALSKRVHSHVIVSLRDKTFVRHRAGSVFDAYELRKLWLDPPPFQEVLSSRLTYSKNILSGKTSTISMSNGIKLTVPDLSVFFDIVQRSILNSRAGKFIESVADLNIRKGLNLVTNFLTSGHIEADRALSSYLKGYTKYYFPFHEIFKGTMLSQWKFYKEERSDCVNLFNSNLSSKNLQLLRAHILKYLYLCASSQDTIEVSVIDCLELFSKVGASEKHVLLTLKHLEKYALIKSNSLEDITIDSKIYITKCGGYYIKFLINRLVYIDNCILDSSIEDEEIWGQLSDLTISIDKENNSHRKMTKRRKRASLFLDYLLETESLLCNSQITKNLMIINDVKDEILTEFDSALYLIYQNSPQKEHINLKRTHSGAVIKYKSESGFGFVRTEQGKDLFFHVEDLKNKDEKTLICIGTELEFNLIVSDKGLNAKNIILASKEAEIGRKFSGEIIQFNEDDGFGFISQEERDVYFHLDDIAQINHFNVRVGNHLEFNIVELEKGPRAKDINFLPLDNGDSKQVEFKNNEHTEVLQEDKIYTGRIVKFSNYKSYGFIEVPEERDVFFHLNDNLNISAKDIQIGLSVEFTIVWLEKGPSAQNLKIA